MPHATYSPRTLDFHLRLAFGLAKRKKEAKGEGEESKGAAVGALFGCVDSFLVALL